MNGRCYVMCCLHVKYSTLYCTKLLKCDTLIKHTTCIRGDSLIMLVPLSYKNVHLHLHSSCLSYFVLNDHCIFEQSVVMSSKIQQQIHVCFILVFISITYILYLYGEKHNHSTVFIL